MKTISLAFLLQTILSFLAPNLSAQTSVNADPTKQILMSLGRGHHPRKVADRQRELVIADGSPTTQQTNATSGGLFSSYYIQNQYDLFKQFKLNGSLTAKLAKLDGKLTWDFARSIKFSANDVHLAYVCNKDFGLVSFSDYVLHPEFQAFVTSNKLQGLTGPALHNRVADYYGSHFISGYQSSATAFLVYSFHFDSTITAQRFKSDLNLNFTSTKYEAHVTSLLDATNRNTRVTVHFFNSNPAAPVFVPSQNITDTNTFFAVQNQFTSYCNTYLTNGVAVTYQIKPLANLGTPYLNFLDGYLPGTERLADYDRFLEVFGRLQDWNDTFNQWVLDPNRMSWLNASGQNLVVSLRNNSRRYLKSLQALAKDHFESGADLTITDDIIGYTADLGQIPLPKLSVIDILDVSTDWVIGVIDSGSISNTIPNPFQLGRVIMMNGLIEEIPDETNDGLIFYDYNAFLAAANASDSRLSGDRFNTPVWSAVRTLATRNRIGFWFWHTDSFRDKDLLIKDAAGNVVDIIATSNIGLRN